MANKKSKQLKPKTAGKKGGSSEFGEMGSPAPVKKNKKQKQK